MNILIISQSLTGGGAEKVAANLSLELAKRHNVYFLTYIKSDKEYEYGGKRININSDGDNIITRVIEFIRRIFIILFTKYNKNIDYSISFVPQCDYANILSYRKNTKRVIEVSSNMSIAFPRGIRKIFRKYILKQADLVATVSKGVEFDLINNWGLRKSKIQTIYNSIDVSHIIDCLQNKSNINLYGNYIIAMGSFRRAKGHWHLIKSFAYIKDKIPNIKLVIIGDGEYKQKYKDLVDSLEIQDRVVFPGYVDNPFPVISNALLMVFPSIYEGFGNAIIEAMVCKVPVIASDCNYGPREIIAPNSDIFKKAEGIEVTSYGILVPPFSQCDIDITPEITKEEVLLADSILFMINNNSLKRELVQNAYEYCFSYDNKAFARKWENFLNLQK